MKRLNFALLLAMLIASCGTATEKSGDEPEEFNYAFFGHTRHNRWDRERVVPALERADLTGFDIRILGGDLTAHSTAHDSTLSYLDELFDLKSPQTHWVPGNHDLDRPDALQKATGRPLFYTRHFAGVTYLFLDSNDSLNTFRGAQMNLIRTVTDSIHQSSHLIFATHHLVWLAGHPDLEKDAGKIINGQAKDCPQCLNPNNFWSEVYPLLQAVQERGVQVLCVAGDIGWKKQTFEFSTPEGVVLLASGLDSAKEQNYYLHFTHRPGERSLRYEFRAL